MKKEIHPEYRDVVFHDISVDSKFVSGSTIQTNETIEFEGKSYPYVKVDISAASHPFYTGQQKIIDTEGRVDKFKKRYGRGKK